VNVWPAPPPPPPDDVDELPLLLALEDLAELLQAATTISPAAATAANFNL
jgi:hypothetical protein